MSTRSNFLKEALQTICDKLKISYDYANFSRLENDDRFVKVFDLLNEINEKSINLNKVVKGNYLFI